MWLEIGIVVVVTVLFHYSLYLDYKNLIKALK